jgi:hypothetical protein
LSAESVTLVAHGTGPATRVHILTATLSVHMTAVVVLAVVSRPRDARAGSLTLESILLIGFYVAASFLVFQLG